MKCIPLAFLLVAATTAGAQAITRYDIGDMTCASVQKLVRDQGAAILRYRSPRSGIVLYDRYVATARLCPSYQTTERDYLPTADRSCPLYHCVQQEFTFSRDSR